MFLYAPLLCSLISSHLRIPQAEVGQVQMFLRAGAVWYRTPLLHMEDSMFRGPRILKFHKYSLIRSSPQPYEDEETETQAQAQGYW